MSADSTIVVLRTLNVHGREEYRVGFVYCFEVTLERRRTPYMLWWLAHFFGQSEVFCGDRDGITAEERAWGAAMKLARAARAQSTLEYGIRSLSRNWTFPSQSEEVLKK